jgi:ADP-ribose pyrophosphatase
LKWNIVDEKTAFSGFFRMVVYRIKHELFAGGFSETLEREVLQRGHAAAVLPYDAKSDSTLLIEQFRTGALENARGPWLHECIAGIVEEGEVEEDVVRREAMEEAGLTLDTVHYLTTYYPTPGGSSETIALYWAPCDLSNAGGHFGVANEGEDIRATVISMDRALAMLDDGEINNSVTMILLLWFFRHKQTLNKLT